MDDWTIYTANAIIIRSNKLLVVKDNNKWVLPGGRIENDESDLQALKRELFEKLSIDINEENVKLLGYFQYDKAYKSNRPLEMRVYIVNTSQVPNISDAEITDMLWLDKNLYSTMQDLPKAWFDIIFQELKNLKIINLIK